MTSIPRVIVSALSGGAGKTILSLGLARYWQKAGYKVKPFKKGPDYIDAVWLKRAAGHTTTNLDPFFMEDQVLTRLFIDQSRNFDLALIEGNRGLFDGKDTNGSCSTSHLAKILKTPIVLIIDCTKMTRTIVPIVLGCAHFEAGIELGGIILNRTAGERHRSILRKCVQEYTDVPVLGALPKIQSTLIPERHMGLISDQEFQAEQAIDESARILAQWVDTEKILQISQTAPEIKIPDIKIWPYTKKYTERVSIAVVRDTSLWFYYPENLQALERAGANILEVSLLSKNSVWPEIHGLYLGGGFPETQARLLSSNTGIKNFVLTLADNGLPIYAECGGLMYLCSNLKTSEKEQYPMAGVFPLYTELSKKPQGHGYTKCRVKHPNPFFPVGLEFTGHEFHYSSCSLPEDLEKESCLEMIRGTGLGKSRDGLIYKNTMACYNHLHALSVPSWAENFVKAASLYKDAQDKDLACPNIRL